MAASTDSSSLHFEAALRYFYPEIIELGLTQKDICQIVGSETDPVRFESVVRALRSNQALIIKLTKGRGGFCIESLVAMLAETDQQCIPALQLLDEKAHVLDELIDEGRFNLKHIVSILSGAGSRFNEVFAALEAGRTSLIRLTTGQSRFTANHIATMLEGSRSKTDQTIEGLTSNMETLLEILAEGVFSNSDLVTMLTGAGPALGTCIQSFYENREELLPLLGPDKFTATQIAGILSGAGENLPVALSDLIRCRINLLDLIR